MLKEFKEFVMKGNLVEIAVGLIFALKFKDVIDSFTNGVISPIIGAVVGESSLSDATFDIGDGVVRYGAFLNTVITFVITGFVLFMIVKAYNRVLEASKRRGDEDEVTDPGEDVLLLREIRDELRTRA